MSDAARFTEFIRRVRAGDQQAALDLVREYEPLIRREVRLHLEDRRLSRLFDSLDICQEVMASFFVRAAAGQYDLDRPDQMVRLLVTMARNKLATAARREQRQRRDLRRQADGANTLDRVAGADPTPSQLVAGREMLDEVRRRLSEEEQQIADLRSRGLGWTEVAERMGGTAQARRVQLARATDRVLRELGLEETDDG
jgi:RNA polymerase sigma-70 factor (ECF subfamily)